MRIGGEGGSGEPKRGAVLAHDGDSAQVDAAV